MPQSQGFVDTSRAASNNPQLVRPLRLIGPMLAQVTVEETHNDDLEITRQPVEKGAPITDHAYKRPAQCTIRCGWSNSPSKSYGPDGAPGVDMASTQNGASADQVDQVYQSFLKLQESRAPLDVYTGKRFYQNMLIAGLMVSTTKETENALMVTCRLEQIIIVSTQVITVGAPSDKQQQPQSTAPVADNGVKQLSFAPNYNYGVA